MDNLIVINNLKFGYDEKVIFEQLNLSIERGSFTTILGCNGSGKSTLVRLLTGLESYDGSILIDGLLVCDDLIGSVRKNIGVVFENPDDVLVSETVFEDLAFPLENLNYNRDYILTRVNEVCRYLNISHLLECNPHDLSGGEKQLVCLGSALVISPKLLILDEALSMLDDVSKNNILSILQKINKDFNVTILNITHDIEESVYGDNILVIDNGKVILNDKKDLVYKEEKKLKKLGFNLPFMVDLSNRLFYYDLIDNTIFDMDEMIDLLWK